MKKTNDRKIKIQPFLLLLAALIWGVAFVAQSDAADSVPPFTFNAVRSLLAVAVLAPVVAIRRKKHNVYRTGQSVHVKAHEICSMRDMVISSVICGLLLSAATFLQQYAIQFVQTGKCGFLTALYIVLVPMILMLRGRMPGKTVVIGVLTAVTGLYFLCMSGKAAVDKNDMLLILCALLFAFQIITIDHYTAGKIEKGMVPVDGIELSFGQFIVCTISSAICMLIFERPDMHGIIKAMIPLLYAGIMSSGVAYTLQIVGMKGMNPTAASLLMSMESVFSVLAGWLIQGQRLSGRELFGCVLMFAAIVLVQIPSGRINSKDNTENERDTENERCSIT